MFRPHVISQAVWGPGNLFTLVAGKLGNIYVSPNRFPHMTSLFGSIGASKASPKSVMLFIFRKRYISNRSSVTLRMQLLSNTEDAIVISPRVYCVCRNMVVPMFLFLWSRSVIFLHMASQGLRSAWFLVTETAKIFQAFDMFLHMLFQMPSLNGGVLTFQASEHHVWSTAV